MFNPGCDNYAQINHFFKQFEFEGRRIRSVFFPFLDDIKDGRFSLLYGEAPEIYFYPHLVDLVKGNKFDVPSLADSTKRVYMYGLRELTNFVSANSEVKPRKNYTKKKVVFDKEKLTQRVVVDLREIVSDYYLDGVERETELVVKPAGCSSAEIWYHIPKSLSPEEISKVLFNTHNQLSPRTETSYDEILQVVKSGADEDIMGSQDYEIRDPETANTWVSLEYYTYDQNKMRVGFGNRSDRDRSRNLKYLQAVEMFLRNLETALTKHDKITSKK